MLNPFYHGPKRLTKWGKPPKTFEQDMDPYNTFEFKRRYHREKRRRERGYTDVLDHLHDDTVKHMQCPHEGCKTWFPAPVELVEKKYKRTYTGRITCPSCHKESIIGRSGELEKESTDV